MVYKNQENNVGNRVYNYIKLINNLIQVAINFLETYGHVSDTRNSSFGFNTCYYFNRVHGFGLSSLEQGMKTKLNLV